MRYLVIKYTSLFFNKGRRYDTKSNMDIFSVIAYLFISISIPYNLKKELYFKEIRVERNWNKKRSLFFF